MTRSITIILVSLLTIWRAYSQTGILQVLSSVEQNNKELQAHQHSTDAQKLQNKAENNLPDPFLSYVYLWDAVDPAITCDELTIEQSFDFPSTYFARKNINRMKNDNLNYQYQLKRQEILLQAKEICLDIIQLRQQRSVLKKMLQNTQNLVKEYKNQLQLGNCHQYEYNKINMELMKSNTALAQNEMELFNKMKALEVLNGNQPIYFSDSLYQDLSFPIHHEQLAQVISHTHLQITSMKKDISIAEKEIQLAKMQWAPELALGYRRTTDAGDPANGFTIGISFPIFANRFNVKIANEQKMEIALQQENAIEQLQVETPFLIDQANMLRQTLLEYKNLCKQQDHLNTLQTALNEGQINLTDYFIEVGEMYENEMEIIAIENEYQKTMAQIYRNEL